MLKKYVFLLSMLKTFVLLNIFVETLISCFQDSSKGQKNSIYFVTM